MKKIYEFFRSFHTWRSNKICVLLGILIFSGIQVFAQNRMINGVITSGTDGTALPGVSILIKGTTAGTISDMNGRYSIEVSDENSILVFSYVGFSTQEIPVSGRSDFDVVLSEDATQLADIVITALGIEKDKSKLGYAVQEVEGSDIIKAREPNPINSLTGKVAGLTVTNSAELLGSAKLYLRGKRPLFVVDGVPIQSDTWNISPDDIESFTVLKGPAASALYGSRGQFGAIQIITKRGTKNNRGFSVDFNSSTMWENGFMTIPKVQYEYGPGDHGRYAFADGKGGGLYDSDYDVWGPPFEGQLIPQYDGEVSPTETFTTTFPSGTSFTGNIRPTPWVARGKDNLERFLDPGLLSTNNIAVSANTEMVDLRASYTHTYQKGIVPTTNLNADNFNITTGIDFSEKVRFESNLNYNHQYTENFPDVQYGPNSMIYNIIIWAGADWDIEDMRNYWQPGKEGLQQIYAEYTRYNNPYFLAHEWQRGHYKTDLYGYMTLKYKPLEFLEIMGRTQVNTYDLFRSEKFPYSAGSYGREQYKGDYREDYRTLFENNTDLLVSFDKDLSSDFNLSTSVGGNIRTFSYRSSYTTTDYLNVPASSLVPGAFSFENTLNPIKAFNFYAPMSVYSAYAFVDLSYRDFMNLSVTGRWDKHSTLPTSKNSYFYPSVSLSSVLSEALALPDLISNLQLRLSWANVGSALTTPLIGPIPSTGSITGNPLGYGSTFLSPYDGPSYINSAVYNTPLVYNNQPGAYYPNQITNPNLEPNFSSAWEAGANVQVLEDRLGVDVNYFLSNDGPGIFNLPLSEASGFTSAIVNGIETKRTGWEVTLNAMPVSSAGGFSWDVLVNWSTYKETLEAVYGDINNLGLLEIGDRMDRYYAGAFYRTPDGEYINDGGGRPIRTPVSQYLGNLNPDWTWGFVNKLNYRNWSLGFQFDGRVGGILIDYIQRQTFRGGRHIETTQGAMGEARYQDYLGIKSWIGPGVVISNGASIEYDDEGNITNYDELQFAPNTTPTFLQDWISRVYAAEEANVISRSYAKLREVTLTYNLPASMLSRTFINAASFSLVGRNLLYFAEKTDVDIDQFGGGESYSDLQSPTLRRYGFNINLTF